MIFKPEMCDAILSGRKTVTRRPIKPGPCKYEVGKSYAIQPGRGKHAVARLRVVDVDMQRLGWIDNMDATREGFAHKGAFMDYWRKLYHGQFFRGQLVWRIEFELEPESARD